jgi:hypothetical protein
LQLTVVHIPAFAATSLTLYGKGTRIDFVSYIAFKPSASPSNISGPMRLEHTKTYSIPSLPEKKANHHYLHNLKARIMSSEERFSLSAPIGLHKEGPCVSIIALSIVNAATTNGPDPFYLCGLPFCKNPFPDWVMAQSRHCETPDKPITGKQLR